MRKLEMINVINSQKWKKKKGKGLDFLKSHYKYLKETINDLIEVMVVHPWTYLRFSKNDMGDFWVLNFSISSKPFHYPHFSLYLF
jgi:hypothetical protein